jgi:hypothetical protein
MTRKSKIPRHRTSQATRAHLHTTYDAWQRAAPEMREWVNTAMEAEQRAKVPGDHIWVGATDFGADIHIAVIDSSVIGRNAKGGPGSAGMPFRQFEDFIADACCDMWKAGNARIVMSQWNGAKLRGERRFGPPPPDALGHLPIYFCVEMQLLAGVLREPMPGYIAYAPDAEIATAMMMPRRSRT